jgi:hypothetical protein
MSFESTSPMEVDYESTNLSSPLTTVGSTSSASSSKHLVTPEIVLRKIKASNEDVSLSEKISLMTELAACFGNVKEELFTGINDLLFSSLKEGKGIEAFKSFIKANIMPPSEQKSRSKESSFEKKRKENPHLETSFFPKENLRPDVTREYQKELVKMASEWSRETYSAPYTTLIQSSGVGKSFHTSQLGHSCWLFYICLRPKNHTGFPKRSSIANFIQNPLGTIDELKPRTMTYINDSRDYNLPVLFYSCFLISCVEKLKDWLSQKLIEHPEPSGEQVCGWKKCWSELLIRDGPAHEAFWEQIEQKTKEKIQNKIDFLEKNEIKTIHDMLDEELAKVCIDFDKLNATIPHLRRVKSSNNTIIEEKDDQLVLFAFDEANSLFTHLNLTGELFNTAFHYLRYAMTGIPINGQYFFLIYPLKCRYSNKILLRGFNGRDTFLLSLN